MAQAFSIGKAAHHNGKRLVAAALATAQLDHRLLIGGVAGQMESAQALDGDNTAAGQQLDTAVDNGVAGLARGADGQRRGGFAGSSPTLASRHMICGPQLKQASGCA